MKKISFRVKKNISSEEKILRKLTREQQTFFYICRSDSVEMLYVKNLFRSAEHRPRSQALLARLIPTKVYEWRDDFRFSTRVLCIYSSIALLLYFVAIQAHVRGITALDGIRKKLQIFLNANIDQEVTSMTSNFPVPSLVGPYLFAVYFSLIIIIIQLFVFLANIRRNLFQLFRGDDTEIPRRQRSQYIPLSLGNIHFAGYFIGYLIWSLILMTNIDDLKRTKSSSRYVRKWKLAVFLARNPTIVFFRKVFLMNNKDRSSINICRTSTARLSIRSNSVVEYF